MKDEASGAASRSGRERDYGVAPPGRALPASVRLGPVHLQVSDLGRSEAFYSRTLGLTRLEGGRVEEERGALGPDGSGVGALPLAPPAEIEPLLLLSERPGADPVPGQGRLGLFHYALRVPHRPALGRMAARLRNLGLRIGVADHGVSEALYLSDPDGLGIEVYRDRPRGEWRSRNGELLITTEPLDLEGLIAEAEETPEARADTEPLAGAEMGHVHLRVGDLDEAARFYHRGLGFEKVNWSYPGALFLSAGGYHHHLGLNTWSPSARTAGEDDARLLSWTLVLPGMADVAQVTESLETAGFPVRKDRGGTTVRLRARDPWGTEVEIRADQVERAGLPHPARDDSRGSSNRS